MPIFVFVLSLALAAPIFAMLSEGWFNLAPCELCLWQRWPYWLAAALAALGLVLPRLHPRLAPRFYPSLGPWLLLAAGLAALISAMIGGFHLGVELRWWPSPLAGCAAPQVGAGASIEDLMRSLSAVPNKPCDEPAYLFPGFPLSMAGMNTIYGLVLAAIAWNGARRA